MKLPRITSTTKLVRDISVITEAPKDQIQIITKGRRELGVYMPMELFRKYGLDENINPSNDEDSLKVSKKTQSKLKKINGVKYQRSLREEY